ncbi:MAG: leucine-rich repeat protein, partial [Paludibacteraceae bacterium]
IIDNVFNNASNLASVVVEDGNPVYDSRDNCNAIIETATNTLVAGCKKTTFPSTITRIRTHAFMHNHSISSVVIPDNVTVIEEGAFDCCYGLSTVRTGNGITEIAPGAQLHCFA